ncbi:hypothetical protein MPSEU_000236500 [Mayamaea pseudoterrestris]|nr:hypothetical protein MPSEU_000236500 [Mayamaea pseudoterrestris]
MSLVSIHADSAHPGNQCDNDDDDDSPFPIQPIKRKARNAPAIGAGKKIKINIFSKAAVSDDSSASHDLNTGAFNSADELTIQSASLPISNSDNSQSSARAFANNVNKQATQSTYIDETALIPSDELDDTLAFFAETHEDQDPAFQRLEQLARRQALQEKLASLKTQDTVARQEIDKFINDQLQAKLANAELSLEKYKLRASQDEKKDSQKLYEVFTEKSSHNLQKINQSMKLLRNRHTAELQNAMQAHQQHQQQRSSSINPNEQQQFAAAGQQEWHNIAQQIQIKHQRQVAEFAQKSDELKNRMATEYKREQEKIKAHLDHRLGQIQVNRRKMTEKLTVSFQQIRQRYIKRHLQKLLEQEQAIVAEIRALDIGTGSGSADGAETTIDHNITSLMETQSSEHHHHDARSVAKPDRIEFRQPAPITSKPIWARGKWSGAAARHKHRKTVMSHSSRQLSLEIHNEGLWISLIVHKDSHGESNPKSTSDDKKNSSGNEQFIPWGIRAHDILCSVTCGEIPAAFEQFNFGEAAELQSGQVRCVLVDLRTSEESAATLRATSMSEHEHEHLAELKKRADMLITMAAETEKQSAAVTQEEKEYITAADAARKDIDKYKRAQDEFLHKFRQYFGPDGSIIAPNPSDRQKLEVHVADIKSKLARAEEREMLAKQKTNEIKSKGEQLAQTLKVAQRNVVLITNAVKQRQVILSGRATQKQMEAFAAERSGSRIRDFIGSLKKVAAHRRELLNEKKNSNVSMAWLQSFPGLTSALKKSLWHKMHRRKQQIVLRPTHASFLKELRSSALENLNCGSHKPLNVEDQLVKVEQLFLLATHPVAENSVSTVPSARGDLPWAEPGCLLDLSVEPTISRDRILPCRPSYSVLEDNLSEIASAPGCQAASLLRSSHFKCLAAPLSAVAVASSPAEAGIVPSSPTNKSQSKDPLHLPDNAIIDGYTFVTKLPSTAKQLPATQAQPRQPQARRKSGSSIEPPPASVKPAPAIRQQSTSSVQSMNAAHTVAASQKADSDSKIPRRRNSSSKVTTPPNLRPSDLGVSQRSVAPPSESPRNIKNVLNANFASAVSSQGLLPAQSPTTPGKIPLASPYGQFVGQLPVQQKQNMSQTQNMHQQPFFPQPPQLQQQQQQQPQSGPQASPNFMTQQQRQLALQQMMQQQQQRQIAGSSPRRTQQMYSPPQAMQMQQFYAPLNHQNLNIRGQQYPQQPPMPPLGHAMQQRPMQPMPQHAMGMDRGQQQQQVPPQGPIHSPPATQQQQQQQQQGQSGLSSPQAQRPLVQAAPSQNQVHSPQQPQGPSHPLLPPRQSPQQEPQPPP